MELMVVVTILAILIAMLVPNLATLGERGRMKQCTSILHNIGSAMAQYVSDNRGFMCPATWVDRQAYLTLPVYTDANGNLQDLRYGAAYSYHNVLAPYLGLGNCMPVNNVVKDQSWTQEQWLQWCRWANAKYSQYKCYRCPSAESGITSPYTGSVSGFYMQNCSWNSQPQFQCSEWPYRMAYFPKFADTTKAILLYEYWSCNAMTGDLEAAGQPYTTHYTRGPQGAMSIGRNCLYADWRVSTISGGGSEQKPIFTRYNLKVIPRGNEEGYMFTSGIDGRDYVGWVLALRFLTAG